MRACACLCLPVPACVPACLPRLYYHHHPPHPPHPTSHQLSRSLLADRLGRQYSKKIDRVHSIEQCELCSDRKASGGKPACWSSLSRSLCCCCLPAAARASSSLSLSLLPASLWLWLSLAVVVVLECCCRLFSCQVSAARCRVELIAELLLVLTRVVVLVVVIVEMVRWMSSRSDALSSTLAWQLVC